MDAGGVVLFNTGNAAAAAALDTGALSGEEIGEMVNESPSSMGMIGTAHSSTAALVLDPASASTGQYSRGFVGQGYSLTFGGNFFLDGRCVESSGSVGWRWFGYSFRGSWWRGF